MSMTEDDHEEFLRWIDVDDPIKYYPEFFRTELLQLEDGVKHFVTRKYLYTERAHYMCTNMHFGIMVDDILFGELKNGVKLKLTADAETFTVEV